MTASPKRLALFLFAWLVGTVVLGVGAGFLAQGAFGFPWGERVAKTFVIAGSTSAAIFAALRWRLAPDKRDAKRP